MRWLRVTAAFSSVNLNGSHCKRVEVGVDGEKLQLFFKSALFIMATRWWLAVLTTVVRNLFGEIGSVLIQFTAGFYSSERSRYIHWFSSILNQPK